MSSIAENFILYIDLLKGSIGWKFGWKFVETSEIHSR